MMLLGANALINNLSPYFDEIYKRIEEKQTIVMNGMVDAKILSDILIDGGYIDDEKEAEFISEWYSKKIPEKGTLVNLGAVNSPKFKIPADSILLSGSPSLIKRLSEEIQILGQTDEWRSATKTVLPTELTVSGGETAKIKVSITNDRDVNESISKIPVRITEHWINDTIPSSDLPVSHESKVVGFACTDENGVVEYNVPKGKYYSVIPILEGFQYGREKGTESSPLSKDLKFEFKQQYHKLLPFSPAVYRQLKKDNAIISRTPDAYKDKVWLGILVFITAWGVVFITTNILDKIGKQKTDPLLLISLMIITGMGLLTLYGQMRPLTDIYNAYEMSLYIAIGCLMMLVLSKFNYLRIFQWYRGNWGNIFKSTNTFEAGTLQKVSSGYPFLIIAIAMMFLLWMFGYGPEGSDAKVNLFGFQPSEMVKYLVVLFLCFFFIAKGESVKVFGEKSTILSRRRHWTIISVVLVIIAFVSLLFLAMLKDMGPGLVILATFILMYSVVRRDFKQLIFGIISYVIFVGISYVLFQSVWIHCAAILSWFVLWIVIGRAKYKTIYESAIFFNALVSLFLIGGTLLKPFLPHMAKRLYNRTGMTWSGIFDNAIPEGDQIAQGLWGTASGGFSGMGIGGGSAYFIPAGHTDLILSSLGEQMGWLGILLIAFCFYILVSRTVFAAQYSGHKFTFYLALGLGLLTGVQFLFIALGTVGAIPLSGVPVPFVSYGGTSVVLALSAYGIVLSISRNRGSSESLKAFVSNPRRMKDSAENKEAISLTRNITFGLVLLFIGVLTVVGFNGYYQIIRNGETAIRPVITANSSHLRALEYNPRINQIIDRLDRGNIYDRNGLLLATSDRHQMQSFVEKDDSIKPYLNGIRLFNQRLSRYYPFGNNMVFMVGDLNDIDVYTNYGSLPRGYYAEIYNAEQLKGYDTKSHKIEINSNGYKFNRFVAPIDSVTFQSNIRDYSFILPALSLPIYKNAWIDKFNESRVERDIRLTIDAKLQSKIQNYLGEHISKTPNLAKLRDLRASVVILDSKHGDLLASSNYPLPYTDSIRCINRMNLDTKSGAPSEWRPGNPITERDLGLTYQTAPGSTAKVMSALAGFMKIGVEAYNTGFEIKPYMTVEPPTKEPNTSVPSMNRKGGRRTYMENAIVNSSNCYFIMLVNEKDLYPQLGSIYSEVGTSLSKKWTYTFNSSEFEIIAVR